MLYPLNALMFYEARTIIGLVNYSIGNALFDLFNICIYIYWDILSPERAPSNVICCHLNTFERA